MRRHLLVPLLTVLACAGCGDERPAATPASAPTSIQATTDTAPPSPTATAAPPSSVLEGFPLDLGFAKVNGDDGSPVVVTSKPATHSFEECSRTVWEPRAGDKDVIGVEFRGEAEWARGRTLVLYPTAEAAAKAVDVADRAITRCPRDEGDESGWAEHTGIDYQVGDSSFGWIDRWWSADVDGFDTGLTIYHVAQVGRAVLLTYEYGEGNGPEQQLLAAYARTAKADQPVVDAMGELSGRRPAEQPSVAVTPTGAGPFELGMSVEHVRAVAPDAEIRTRPASCTGLAWTSPQGGQVFGALDPQRGLVHLSSPQGTTPEGVGSGATLGELRAAYADLEHTESGLWVSGQGTSSYAFNLDAQSRLVNDVMVIGDDQHCAS